MRLIAFNDGYKEDKILDSKSEILKTIHEIGEKYLSRTFDSKKFTTDMDGVLIYDDNAIMAARITAGPEAQDMFGAYANLNIKAVSEGETSYCWYAPTLFVGQLLKGLSPEINRVVGKNMRLIPDVKAYIDSLFEIGYEIVAVTAGHQEAGEEVSKRLGIKQTIGTQLGISAKTRLYDGTVKRFIGGNYKLNLVDKILNDSNGGHIGTHIGDSWSDVETLEGIPNSIAFNPGCGLALKNANISVIGKSKMGLLPFFDYEGRYDGSVNLEDLPLMIILMNGNYGQEDLDLLLQESKKVKKEEIEKTLIRRGKPPSLGVEGRIRNTLKEKGIPFRTKVKNFMPPDEFDSYAKKAYLKLDEL